mmetsp:Transcript_10882/g.35764  ORF Transcript_10882/g.35764 Transcript_10882/m.35764 type:complete len:344 (-) Transcript_10882:33-1064(-)
MRPRAFAGRRAVQPLRRHAPPRRVGRDARRDDPAPLARGDGPALLRRPSGRARAARRAAPLGGAARRAPRAPARRRRAAPPHPRLPTPGHVRHRSRPPPGGAKALAERPPARICGKASHESRRDAGHPALGLRRARQEGHHLGRGPLPCAHGLHRRVPEQAARVQVWQGAQRQAALPPQRLPLRQDLPLAARRRQGMEAGAHHQTVAARHPDAARRPERGRPGAGGAVPRVQQQPRRVREEGQGAGPPLCKHVGRAGGGEQRGRGAGWGAAAAPWERAVLCGRSSGRGSGNCGGFSASCTDSHRSRHFCGVRGLSPESAPGRRRRGRRPDAAVFLRWWASRVP